MHLASHLREGKALVSDLREDGREAVCIVHADAVVVTKGLLIEIAEEMERFNTHIGSADAALQQRPEVFKTVGMNLPVNVCNRMVNNLMRVVASKTCRRAAQSV